MTTKNKGGRPVGSFKYTEDYINALSVKLTKWIQEPDKFWLGTFAAENGFARMRLNEFAERNESFKEAYELAKQVQENKLLMLGLSGKGNCTMAIFALKNVAGWRDEKKEVEDADLKNQELVFSSLPVQGKVPNNIQRFLN